MPVMTDIDEIKALRKIDHYNLACFATLNGSRNTDTKLAFFIFIILLFYDLYILCYFNGFQHFFCLILYNVVIH